MSSSSECPYFMAQKIFRPTFYFLLFLQGILFFLVDSGTWKQIYRLDKLITTGVSLPLGLLNRYSVYKCMYVYVSLLMCVCGNTYIYSDLICINLYYF